MFLTIFSSNESLCMDPASQTVIIIGVVATATVTLINNSGSAINNVCHYYFPSAEDTAIATAAKVNTEAYREELSYFYKKNKYKDCLESSKPDSEITVHGVPVSCEKIMIAFVLCGERAEGEAIEITKRFNRYKKR